MVYRQTIFILKPGQEGGKVHTDLCLQNWNKLLLLQKSITRSNWLSFKECMEDTISFFVESGRTLNKHEIPLKPRKKTETKPVCHSSHAIHIASLIDPCDLDHGEKTKCTGSDPIFFTCPSLGKRAF